MPPVEALNLAASDRELVSARLSAGSCRHVAGHYFHGLQDAIVVAAGAAAG